MYQHLIQHIIQSLQKDLPGSMAHRKMIPPGRKLTAESTAIGTIKYSSILLLLFPDEGKLYTCLTRRNSNMKNHAGQVSFPGGKIDEGENPEYTAMRETQEEVGVSPADIRVLGRLSELYIPISGYSISPYVAWIDYKPKFVLNPDEADKLILFPIQDFIQKEKIKYTRVNTVTGVLEVPYYPFEDEIVWGATAMILSEFFELMKTESLTPQ